MATGSEAAAATGSEAAAAATGGWAAVLAHHQQVDLQRHNRVSDARERGAVLHTKAEPCKLVDDTRDHDSSGHVRRLWIQQPDQIAGHGVVHVIAVVALALVVAELALGTVRRPVRVRHDHLLVQHQPPPPAWSFCSACTLKQPQLDRHHRVRTA